MPSSNLKLQTRLHAAPRALSSDAGSIGKSTFALETLGRVADAVTAEGRQRVEDEKKAHIQLKPEEELKDNMVEFKLSSSDDMHVFNSKVTSIGATIGEAAKKKPDVAVCYHTKTVDVQAPGRFKLALTHRVAFCAKAGSQSEAGSETQEKLSDGNICALEKMFS